MPKHSRDDNKPEEKSLSHQDLLSLKILTPSGNVNFSELCSKMDPDRTWIPTEWPSLKDPQTGYSCGLYALHKSLLYGFGKTRSIPPARKNKSKDIISLRQIAKGPSHKPHSEFGEILDKETFTYLTEYFNFPGCNVVQLTKEEETEEAYTNAILQQLKKNNSVITSCDINDGFPSVENGIATHWGLIFGAFYLKKSGDDKSNKDDGLQLIVLQYENFYVWSARRLFESNQRLPQKNPRAYPHYYYYKEKIGQSKNEFFCKEYYLPQKPGFIRRYAIGDNLDRFRFSLFAVPAPPLKNRLSLKKCEPESNFKRHKKN